jgi:uncharacterized membrane protein YfbV (UPF0208 family)
MEQVTYTVLAVLGRRELTRQIMEAVIVACFIVRVGMQATWVVKSSPTTRHGGVSEKRKYRSYSFLTSALDGG